MSYNTSDARIDAVHAFMRHVNRGDYEGATNFLHDDVAIVEPDGIPYEGVHTGHSGFVAMLRKAMSSWASWRDTPFPYSLACYGDVVYREHSFRAEVRESGAVVEMPFLEIAEFHDDKIARIRPYYFDPFVIAAAVNGVTSQPTPVHGIAANRSVQQVTNLSPDAQIAAVKRYLELRADGKLHDANAYLHADVRIRVPSKLPYGGDWYGRDGAEQLARSMADTWIEWAEGSSPAPLATADTRVFREVNVSAVHRATGCRVTEHVAETFVFSGDRLSEIRVFYANPWRLMKTLGESDLC